MDTGIEKITDISSTAVAINGWVEAFEKRKAEIIELKTEGEGLKVTSLGDKAMIKKIVTIRKKLKFARVNIEKEAKSMRDPLTRINRFIIEKEDELVSLITPTEEELELQEKWIEDEREKVRKEKEERENAKVQARIDQLQPYGVPIDFAAIKAMSDKEFDIALTNAIVEYKKAQMAKLEEERLAAIAAELKKKEAERLADIELEKLKAEKEEVERLRQSVFNSLITIETRTYPVVNFDHSSEQSFDGSKLSPIVQDEFGLLPEVARLEKAISGAINTMTDIEAIQNYLVTLMTVPAPTVTNELAQSLLEEISGFMKDTYKAINERTKEITEEPTPSGANESK